MGVNENDETEDLLSRRMSSGSSSATGRHAVSGLEAANDPSTDTEAFDPIKDEILKEDPRPATGPVKVTAAHSARVETTREVPTSATAAATSTAVMSDEDWAAVSRAATSTENHEPEFPERRTNFFDVIGIIWITVATPFILLAISVRAIASGLFLRFEYFRPGFPADQFGFSPTDRLHYGSYVVDYLLNFDSRRYLADVVMPNGEPVFLSEELNHMADVKALIALLYLIAAIGLIVAIVFALYLSRKNGPGLHVGVRLGSLFSIIFMGGVAVLAVMGWDSFFRGFHKIFFANGTWEFYIDDSLIRLFPPQFWVDSGIAGGGIFVLLAIILFVFSFAGAKRRRARRKAIRAARES